MKSRKGSLKAKLCRKRFKAETSRDEPVSLSQTVSAYHKRNDEYVNTGVNQSTLEFLRRMSAHCQSKAREHRTALRHVPLKLFEQLFYICQLLHMNELEMALWSLYKEKTGDCCLDELSLFLATAYGAKKFFNVKQTHEVYYNEICEKHPKFKTKYEQWSQRIGGMMSISAEAVNARYNNFRQVTPTISHDYSNYNQVVEHLISTIVRPNSKMPPNLPSSDRTQAKSAEKAQSDPFDLSIDQLPNDPNDSTITERNSNFGNSSEIIHEEQKATEFKFHFDALPDLDHCGSSLDEHFDLFSSDDEEQVFENGQGFFDEYRFEDASLLVTEPKLKQRRSKKYCYRESELLSPLCFPNIDVQNGCWNDN